MLVRGLLSCLPAGPASTSTPRDLFLLARTIHRTASQQARLSQCNALKYESRSYATSTADSAKKKPTTRKPAAKSTRTRSTSAKRSTTKTKAKGKGGSKVKKAAPKKKKRTVAKKKVSKRKPRVRREPTPDEKRRIKIKELKNLVLREPDAKPTGAYRVYFSEQVRPLMDQRSISATEAVKVIAENFKKLTPVEKERYTSIAAANKVANETALNAWIASHTIEEISEANNARRYLRRLLGEKQASGRLSYPPHTSPLKDDRHPKRHRNPFILFMADYKKDLSGVSGVEILSRMRAEYESLSKEQKDQYEQASKADRQRYHDEMDAAFGRSSSKK